MIEPMHLFWASLSAAGVTLAGTWLLAERLRCNEERRRERRAFAEAALRCCNILDDIVVRYWGEDKIATNQNAMKILERRILAELEKLIGLIAASSRLNQDKKSALRDALNHIYDEMCDDFESLTRVANAAKVGAILTAVISIRLEVNEMRAG